MLTIYKYADVSTCHITVKDKDILEAQEPDMGPIPSLVDRFPLTVAKYREGFFIPIGEGEEWLKEMMDDLLKAGLSMSFIKLLGHCIKEGVYVLRLDADGNEIAGLPKHEW